MLCVTEIVELCAYSHPPLGDMRSRIQSRQRLSHARAVTLMEKQVAISLLGSYLVGLWLSVDCVGLELLQPLH